MLKLNFRFILFTFTTLIIFNSCNKNETFISKTETECTAREIVFATSWINFGPGPFYGETVNVSAKIEPFDYGKGYKLIWTKPNGQVQNGGQITILDYRPADEGVYKVFGQGSFCRTKEYTYTLPKGISIASKCNPQDNWYNINGLKDHENMKFSPNWRSSGNKFIVSSQSSATASDAVLINFYKTGLKAGKYDLINSEPTEHGQAQIYIVQNGSIKYISGNQGELIISKAVQNRTEITVCDENLVEVGGTNNVKITLRVIFH